MAREMKDSGIEWIGEIPMEWNIKRLKNLSVVIRGGSPRPIENYLSPDDTGYNWIRIGDSKKGSKYIDSTERKIIPDGLKKSRFVKKGSLILSNSMSFGQPYILKIDGCIHDGWVALSDIAIYKEFMYYFLISESARCQFQYQVAGGVVQNLNIDKIGSTFLPVPDYKVQQSIADFLDTQCTHIDSVIEKTRAAIEGYKKLKQAVITQAVTKGIRPNREMKDSGIEWVGYMPLEWDSINPKALFSVRKDKAQVGERQLTASQQHGVIYQDEYMELTGNKVVTVEKDFDILKHVEIGDFVISMRSFQGGLEYSSKSGSISSAYVMLIPNHKHVFSRFYRWLLKSSVYIKALQSTTNMVRDGQAMRFANFIKVRLISVPMEEQREIADYLDEKTAAIDSLIQKKEQLITELEAYKKSLIYEYVTGKKEVSDHETIAFSTDLQVALLICKILKSTNIKGRIHLQKVIFALDILLNLFEETQYYRYPHGPYDLQIEKYESILVNQGWINISKIHGHIKYNKTDRFNDFEKLYLEVFETNDAEIQSICSLFNVGRTSKAEKMATVLASWNDFLIDGIAPTDDMIINDIVTNWTVNKANIAEKTWREELRQLKEKQLVPKGYGKHTLKKEQDSYAH